MAKYTPRLTAPSTTDKNWIHYSKGGYNYCIEIKNGSCLPNCVGYAWGRWREILGKKHKLSLNNAENWWGNTADGYKRGQIPKVGAIMCWRKGKAGVSSDGAGHVAVVEKINSDGSVTYSNSNYSGTRFFTKTSKAPYALGSSAYVFQGFIYLPIEFEEDKPSTTTKPSTSSLEFKEGDIVSFAGGKHYGSTDATSGATVKASKAKVTATSKSGKHPYHIRAVDDKGAFIGGGVYGWVDASTVSAIKTETVTKPTATTTTATADIADGTKLTLKNVILYASSDTTVKSGTKSGTYYVWSKYMVNNRIRITNSKANVGNGKKITGWISYTDAKKSVGTTTTTKKEKTLEDWAREVIAGKHGNGIIKRTASLKKAGCPYSYAQVQAKVNALV